MTKDSTTTDDGLAEAQAAIERAAAAAAPADQETPVESESQPVEKEDSDVEDSDGYDREKAVKRLQYDVPKALLEEFDDETVEKMHRSAQKRDAKFTSMSDENAELRRRVEQLESSLSGEATDKGERKPTSEPDLSKSMAQLLAKLGMDGDDDAQKALSSLLDAAVTPLKSQLAALAQTTESQAQATERRQLRDLRTTLEDTRASLAEDYPRVESDDAFQTLLDAATRAKKAGKEGTVPDLLRGAAEVLWGEPATASEETQSERPKRSKSTQASRPSRKGSPASMTPEQRELRAARAAIQGKSRSQLEVILHG